MQQIIRIIAKGALCSIVAIVMHNGLRAQNPIIRDQYSADPTARVFGDSLYVYPSHDILATKGYGRPGWFCMQDYHVFSTGNLTDWKDHGVILSQKTAPWVDSTSYSMWAPDCIYKNGRYYFYFPANIAKGAGRGFGIGVAVSQNPYGPFTAENKPIEGVQGIDPNVFIDKDGQAYLFWAQKDLFAAKLKDNMLELASAPAVIGHLPEKGLKEGPFVFERKGKYYLTYPHVADKTERLEYAMADHPMGPYKVTGVIMDQRQDCWTNHQSIVKFKNQWYLFYHYDDYSPGFDKARSVRADSLFFNPDGTIQKVQASLRGIGISEAGNKIQLDRYSKISDNGVRVDFLDTLDKFKGWMLHFNKAGSWVQYNTVRFADKSYRHLQIRVKAEGKGDLRLRLDDLHSPDIAQVTIEKSKDWQVLKVALNRSVTGLHQILLTSMGRERVSVDWIRFL